MKIRLKILNLLFLCSTLIFASCASNGEQNYIPEVTTVDVTQITDRTATIGVVVNWEGNAEVTARGVCWSSTSSTPTISDNITGDSTTTDDFTVTIKGLSVSTTYYARAYATNAHGTGYGAVITFTTTGPQALVFIDYVHMDDHVIDALTAQGYTPTAAASLSDFKTGLASGAYTMAVLFAQNYSAVKYGLAASDVQDYIDGGGLMVFTTWTSDDSSIVALFEANLSGSTNLSNITISDTDIQSVSGLSAFTILNPSWGYYSLGLTATGSGTVLATFENGEAAMVLGNSGRTMMLGYMSDTVPTANSQAIFESIVAKLTASLP